MGCALLEAQSAGRDWFAVMWRTRPPSACTTTRRCTATDSLRDAQTDRHRTDRDGCSDATVREHWDQSAAKFFSRHIAKTAITAMTDFEYDHPPSSRRKEANT